MLNSLSVDYEYKLHDLDVLISDSLNNKLSHKFRNFTSDHSKNIMYFSKRNYLKMKKEIYSNNNLENLKEIRTKCINDLNEIEKKYSNLDVIFKFFMTVKESAIDGSLSYDKMKFLKRKHDIHSGDYEICLIIYNKYNNLIRILSDLDYIIENYDSINMSYELLMVKQEKNNIDQLIYDYNLKYVDTFIKNSFKYLSVDKEKLYDICLPVYLKTIEWYDLSKNMRFSKFITGHLFNVIKKNCFKIIGHNWNDYCEYYRVQNVMFKMSMKFERPVNIGFLIRYGYLNEEDRKYEKLEFANSEIVFSSLDYNGDNKSFDDYYEDEDYINNIPCDYDIIEDIDKKFMRNVLISDLKNLLNHLPDRERIIIVLYYGLDRNVYLSYDERKKYKYISENASFLEISKVIGLSHQRIQKIVEKAFRSLRECEEIKDYYR